MTVFWTILLIALVVFEASTANLICIWFAGGALCSLICSMLSLSIWIQIVVFIAVTAILLFVTKPIVTKLRNNHTEKTNTDALIGKTAIVTESISNIDSVGAVKLGAMTWSARSENDSRIEKGSVVTVQKIDGVKLIVK